MKGLTWPNYEGEPRIVPGVPSPRGGYGPGIVLPLSEAGLTEDEAAKVIAGTGLEIVDLPEPEAPKTKTKKGGD
jgi:hypothetical protein